MAEKCVRFDKRRFLKSSQKSFCIFIFQNQFLSVGISLFALKFNLFCLIYFYFLHFIPRHINQIIPGEGTEKKNILREAEDQHSQYAVSVHSEKTNQIMKVIEHILGELAKLVNRLISDWKVLRQQKLMGNIKVHQRKHGCLVKELIYPLLLVFVWRKSEGDLII